MKDVKDIILERRIGMLQVDGKKVPDQYIQIFNDYLEQIADSLKYHDQEVRTEVIDIITKRIEEDYDYDDFIFFLDKLKIGEK